MFFGDHCHQALEIHLKTVHPFQSSPQMGMPHIPQQLIPVFSQLTAKMLFPRSHRAAQTQLILSSLFEGSWSLPTRF